MKESNKLTEMEQQVVDHLKTCDEFDDMPCDCFESISDHTKIPANQLRGVIASLIKKDKMVTGEYPNGLEAYYLFDRSLY